MFIKFEIAGRIRNRGEKKPKSHAPTNTPDSESEENKASSRFPRKARRKSQCLRILLSFIAIKEDAI